MRKRYTPSNDDRTARLAQLERERDELAASLPAHSVPAAHLIRLEDLEEEIATLRSALESTPADTEPSPSDEKH